MYTVSMLGVCEIRDKEMKMEEWRGERGGGGWEGGGSGMPFEIYVVFDLLFPRKRHACLHLTGRKARHENLRVSPCALCDDVIQN